MTPRMLWNDLLTAIQFVTRVPVPSPRYDAGSLSRSAKFFPAVGLLIGSLAALIHYLISPHLPRLATAFVVVLSLVLLTGCFHEDGLADAADGFGGGWTPAQVMLIMRDSRIGAYGAAVMTLSLTGRMVLLTAVPAGSVGTYLIAAHVLCRWTTLPLSYFLPPARTEGEGLGRQVAQLTSLPALLSGTVFTLAVVLSLLHFRAVPAILAAVLITLISGIYYRHRIGGVTGDCFGATNQLTEIGIYLCAAWIAHP